MPQKSKLDKTARVEWVQKYLLGEVGQNEAAEMLGVHRATFQHWVKRYETEADEGLVAGGMTRVYSVELKRAAVEEYLKGGISQENICKKYKIRAPKQLRDWIKVYNSHGDFSAGNRSGGGSNMRKARSTTQEERIRIVKECIASGKNYGKMALKHQVSYQQVRTWTIRFEELGEPGLEDRRGQRKKDQEPRTELEKAQVEIKQLKHRLYLAEMEMALLKKAAAIERGDASQK